MVDSRPRAHPAAESTTYEPRFGRYATERPSGARRPTDSMGEDVAGTYRDAIAALRPRAQAPAA